LVELVTEQGWRFFSCAEVKIGGKSYDMDELNEDQKRYVSGKLNEQAMNAAFVGKARFKAKNLPEFEELFT